jgi:hypothetical protein
VTRSGERGLGPFPLIGLEAARDHATDARRAAREGRDISHLAVGERAIVGDAITLLA